MLPNVNEMSVGAGRSKSRDRPNQVCDAILPISFHALPMRLYDFSSNVQFQHLLINVSLVILLLDVFWSLMFVCRCVASALALFNMCKIFSGEPCFVSCADVVLKSFRLTLRQCIGEVILRAVR